MKKIYFITIMSMSASLCAMQYKIIKSPDELNPGKATTWHAREYLITDRAYNGNNAKITMQRYSHRFCGMPFGVETVTRTFKPSQTISGQWDEETASQRYDPSAAVVVPPTLAFCLACLYFLN